MTNCHRFTRLQILAKQSTVDTDSEIVDHELNCPVMKFYPLPETGKVVRNRSAKGHKKTAARRFLFNTIDIPHGAHSQSVLREFRFILKHQWLGRVGLFEVDVDSIRQSTMRVKEKVAINERCRKVSCLNWLKYLV
jgi:hypothetical protein